MIKQKKCKVCGVQYTQRTPLHCNMQLSGNIENYRPALIAKIGQERHDSLINNNEVKRWTKDECKAIEAEYKAKLKVLNETQAC